MSLLKTTDEIVSEIESSVSGGHVVIMPEEDVHIGDWNGTGYIILDMNSGSGIYRISGGLNGGYTQGEVVYDAMVDFGLELSWIIEGLISIFSVINTVAAKGILTAGMTGNVIIAGLFVGLTLWSCANTFTLLGAYLDGDEAAGEAIVKETITDAIMTIGFMMFKYVAKPIVELLVKNKLIKTLGSEAVEKLLSEGYKLTDINKLIKNLRKWNVADDVISEFAKNFGKEGLTWLEKASKQGLSSEIMTQLSQLEGFADNMDDILEVLKLSSRSANEVADCIIKYGEKAAEAVRKYGDEAVDAIGMYGDAGHKQTAKGRKCFRMVEKD